MSAEYACARRKTPEEHLQLACLAFASGASESKRQIAQSMFGLSLIPRITEYLKDFKLCAVLKQLDVGELENFQMTTCTGCVWTEVDAGEL